MSSSSSLQDKFDELDLTPDELRRFHDALQKEEFRKLFIEYAEEISNPENRALYEKEIRELEKERGMDVKFVKPEPGYVLKTTVNGTTKAFINICKSDQVGPPASEKKTDGNGKQGLSWSIPHMFSQPREDFAKDKKRCQVYDFVVHPHTYRLAETNPRFKGMISDLAIEGVQKMFSVTLDQKNCKQLKMHYKGPIVSSVIRNKIPDAKVTTSNKDDLISKFPYPYGDESSMEKAERLVRENEIKTESDRNKTNRPVKEKSDDRDDHTIPKYEIKHQSDVDMQSCLACTQFGTNLRPQRLIIEVLLPLLCSASFINLDVFEQSIKLKSEKPAKYQLELNLPFPVDENTSSAKFDKTKHKLTIRLSVLPLECPRPDIFGDSLVKENDDPQSVGDTLVTSNEEEEEEIDNEDSVSFDMDDLVIEMESEDSSGISRNKTESETSVVERNSNLLASNKLLQKISKVEHENIPLNLNEHSDDEQTCEIGADGHDVHSEEIVIVHDKECPKLHGILKQRSTSDSSEDHFVASCEHITSGEECDDYEDEKSLSSSLPSSFGSKKSVSFSDHVDQTVYQINQSVSTLHATLKNRKKKLKKREQRQEAHKVKQERRRIRSSGSFSCDSGGEDGGCSEKHVLVKHHINQGRNREVNRGSKHQGSSSGCYSCDLKKCSSKSSDDSPFSDECTKDNNARAAEDKSCTIEPADKIASSHCNNEKVQTLSVDCVDSGIKELSYSNPEGVSNSDEQHESKMTKESSAASEKQTKWDSSKDNQKYSIEKPETILSWNDVTEKRDVKCPVDFENSHIFSLDLE